MTGTHPNLYVPQRKQRQKKRNAEGQIIVEEIVADAKPTKIIEDNQELEQFLQSPSFQLIINWIESLNKSVKSIQNSTLVPISMTITNILSILDQMDNWIKEIPALTQRSRFGNKAFVSFTEKVEENLRWIMKKTIGNDNADKVKTEEDQQLEEELMNYTSIYFLHCFGDKQRIDYGSGHELNFVIWLFCLNQLGILKEEDHTALVLRVFNRYLEVMRHLQLEYWLEPAGSHGVWGLDDYQFLPFLFGSSQLIDHKHIHPKSICNTEVIEGFAKEYMYLRCIEFINQVKNGSFFEHSPLLFDISGAKTWQKVNEGMIKMFKAEVLGKLPIMKHFFFGKYLPIKLLRDAEEEDEDHHNHNHSDEIHTGPCLPSSEEEENQGETSKAKFRVQSCCVQRIPSSIAAKILEEGQSRSNFGVDSTGKLS